LHEWKADILKLIETNKGAQVTARSNSPARKSPKRRVQSCSSLDKREAINNKLAEQEAMLKLAALESGASPALEKYV